MDGRRLPLSMMDGAIAAQTYPGRPMSTHHGLEFTAPCEVSRLRRAVRHLVEQCDVLRSTLQGGVRVTTDVSEARLDAAIEVALGRAADSRWLDRELSLETEWPFRVRLGQLEGRQELVFTLHHGVTDGHGALRLFDWLVRALVDDASPPSPLKYVQPKSPGLGFWLKVLATALRQGTRLVAHRATLLDRPDAELEGFGLNVVDVPQPLWHQLKSAATRLNCTRNTLLWCAALRASQRLRAGNTTPFRVVGGIDLRGFFATHSDPRNWIGTLEAEFRVREVQSAGLERLVDERLTAARQPRLALVSPLLMRLMVSVGSGLARALFRWTDTGARPFMYSLVLSHIRPTPEVWTWPVALGPVRLWCASTTPRKPGVSMTLTTIDDHVTLATCWAEPLLGRAQAEHFVGLVLEELEAYGRAAGVPVAANVG